MRLRRYAYVAFLLFLAGPAKCAFAEACPGISPQTVQRLGDRLKKVSVDDSYRFEGLGANKSELVVLWSLRGEACPPIRANVENCASALGRPTLQLHVPPELATRCPGLQAVVNELSSALPAEHPVGNVFRIPASALRLLIAITALVVVVGLLIRHLVAPATGKAFGWGDVGWVTFSLAAATPFFFDLPRVVTVELGAAWIVFAVLLFDRDLLAIDSRAEKLSLLGLFFFSLLLHWSLASGGPGDLHLNLAVIWSSSFALDLRWGPAPIELFRLLALVLGGIRDTHILWCNLILSSLFPVLLYGIVAGLGVHKVAALLAAFVTAAHPLLIAFSGVLERQPTYLVTAAASILGLIVFLQRGRWGPFGAFVLGAVLATTSRPEGAHVLILHVAVLVLVPARRRVRAAAALALALLIPLAFLYVHYASEWKISGPHSFFAQFPLLGTILFSDDFTPLAWIVAWTVGLALGIRRRAAWVALTALLGLDSAWRWTNLYRMFVGHERQVASARYETILLVPFVIGVALLIQALLGARTWLKASVLAAFIVFTATTFRRPYGTLLRPFTVDYEYQFLRRYALTLPPGARLYILDAPIDDIGFLDAQLVGQFVDSTVSFELWSERECDDLIHDPSQTYLYIGSSCAELLDSDPGRPLQSEDYTRWMQDCASVRARVGSDPVEEIDVPARKMTWQDFKDKTARLGVYRLKDPSICALGSRRRWQPEPASASP